MEKLVYKISIDLEDSITGLDAISLVEYPAVEYNFITFSKQHQVELQFEDSEKHIITGVAILADTPIYRVAPDGTEYYVVFDKDTIGQLVEKYSKQSLNNSVNIEHTDDSFVNDVYMIESYIKDSSRGIVPKEFSDIPDGSWIVSYKVENDEVWSKIKTKEVRGLSVQGLFNLIDCKFSKPTITEDYDEEVRSLLHRIIKKLN